MPKQFKPKQSNSKKYVRKGSKEDLHKLYNNRAWRRVRKEFLSRPENALCLHCLKEGRTTLATVVDHIVPHKGDLDLFWDESNWRPCCQSCHNRSTAKYDGGFGNKVKPKPDGKDT